MKLKKHIHLKEAVQPYKFTRDDEFTFLMYLMHVEIENNLQFQNVFSVTAKLCPF